jgi:hypothetical protein
MAIERVEAHHGGVPEVRAPISREGAEATTVPVARS